MTYASSFTGQNADDRRSEADRILHIIKRQRDRLNPKQRDFVAKMDEGGAVSGKQLLWLRDIKDGLL